MRTKPLWIGIKRSVSDFYGLRHNQSRWKIRDNTNIILQRPLEVCYIEDIREFTAQGASYREIHVKVTVCTEGRSTPQSETRL